MRIDKRFSGSERRTPMINLDPSTTDKKPIYGLPKELEAVFFSFRLRWQFGYVHGTQWCVSLHEVSINS